MLWKAPCFVVYPWCMCSLSASVCCALDGRFSPQLQRDRGNLRSLLECGRWQSGSQRIRWICKGSQVCFCWHAATSRPHSWFSICSVPGVCTRPPEIVLHFVGSHGPTMNVYIAKWLSLPALCTVCAHNSGPTHWQTGSKHPTQQVQTWG